MAKGENLIKRMETRFIRYIVFCISISKLELDYTCYAQEYNDNFIHSAKVYWTYVPGILLGTVQR